MQDKSRRMLIRFLIVLLLCSGLALAYGAITSDRRSQESEAAAVTAYNEDLRLNTANGPVDLKVELAADNESVTRGLMFRHALGKNQGMLFIFPDTANRAFWMKNTFIPLDLVFMDAGRQVLHIAHNAKPHDESLILSQLPAKYVLEVPAGQTATWGLSNGDRGEGSAFNRGDTLAQPAQPAVSQQPASEEDAD